jgi:hypothetical protein
MVVGPIKISCLNYALKIMPPAVTVSYHKKSNKIIYLPTEKKAENTRTSKFSEQCEYKWSSSLLDLVIF